MKLISKIISYACYVYVDKRKGDIEHSIADIDKMSEINFKADSSNFEKQINETIQWFKEN